VTLVLDGASTLDYINSTGPGGAILSAGAVLDNEGTLTFADNAALTRGDASAILFRNDGAVIKPQGASISTLAVPTVSPGSIEVDSGRVSLAPYDGSTSIFSGPISGAAGTTLEFAAGTGGTIEIDGSLVTAGNVLLDDQPATYRLTGRYSAAATYLVSASATFTGEVDSLGALSATSGSAVAFNPTVPLTVAATNVGLSSSALAGNGRLVLNDSGSYTQDSRSALNLTIAGSNAGTGFDQVSVTGTVSLAGNLNVGLANGFTPYLHGTFKIIDDQGSAPVSGTFAGLPEGAVITIGAVQFQISYVGGDDHNDVVLTTIATPTPHLLRRLRACVGACRIDIAATIFCVTWPSRCWSWTATRKSKCVGKSPAVR
jgi:hypothetical protein